MDEVSRTTFDSDRTTATVAQELELVGAAVAAVASGSSNRVTVAGLRFGDELLPAARALAARHGVRVVPLFHADEHGSDLVVERLGEEHEK